MSQSPAAYLQDLSGRIGNRRVAKILAESRSPQRATLQRTFGGHRTPHDDPHSQEMRIRIDQAMKVLGRSDLTPTARMKLIVAVQRGRWALEQYRLSIGDEDGGGVRGGPMLASTTTVDPASAAIALIAALAVAVLASGGPPGAAHPAKPAQELAEALDELLEPIEETEAARRTATEPTPTQTVDPIPRVEPQPKPKRRPRRSDGCRFRWGPPAGGDPVHDEYARYVAERHGNPMFATVNYFLADSSEPPLAVDFDHHNPDANEFFEAKTRHETLMRDWARNQPAVVARLLGQAHDQIEILLRCAEPGWHLVWYFDDPDVALAAREYLRGLPLEVRHEPWPGGQRPPA